MPQFLRHSTDVSASPARIWELLGDAAQHDRWNTLFQLRQSAALQTGGVLELEWLCASERSQTLRAQILLAIPECELRWRAVVQRFGSLTIDMMFEVLVLANRDTRVTQRVTLRGWGGLLMRWPRRDQMFLALEQSLKNLKELAEERPDFTMIATDDPRLSAKEAVVSAMRNAAARQPAADFHAELDPQTISVQLDAQVDTPPARATRAAPAASDRRPAYAVRDTFGDTSVERESYRVLASFDESCAKVSAREAAQAAAAQASLDTRPLEVLDVESASAAATAATRVRAAAEFGETLIERAVIKQRPAQA